MPELKLVKCGRAKCKKSEEMPISTQRALPERWSYVTITKQADDPAKSKPPHTHVVCPEHAEDIDKLFEPPA